MNKFKKLGLETFNNLSISKLAFSNKMHKMEFVCNDGKLSDMKDTFFGVELEPIATLKSLEQKHIRKWASEALNDAIIWNGSSFNMDIEKPTKGYMVSMELFELVIDLKELSVDDIVKFINKNKLEFDSRLKYLGLWIDEGKIYIDVSVCFSELKLAEFFGVINNQSAVYDVVNEKTIMLGEEE